MSGIPYTSRFKVIYNRIRDIPTFIVARIILGAFMVTIGLSYFYQPIGILSRFGAAITIALCYIACGFLLVAFSRSSWVEWLFFPNYFYLAMLGYLVYSGVASWASLIYTSGTLFFAVVAIKKGEADYRRKK